jgi:hypothetical protein
MSASLLVVATLSIAGAQSTIAGARATSPAKAYAPSGSVTLVSHGVVDLRKQPTIKAGTQTPTQSRPARDVKTPQQRAAYEAAVRNGSIKLPSATQTLTVKGAAAQSPSFVGGGTLPLLVKNFDGLNSALSACGGAGACPPDQAIATDLSYVMEGVNTTIGIYNANTGALQYGPYSADSFFAPVKKAGDIFLEPQMNYDVMRDRWVVVFAEEKPDHSASYLDIAVSQTNSPTQPSPGAQYNVYQFAANFQGAGSYCDYPTLGIDYYGLYVSCVMFNNGGFLGNTIAAFDKTNIYNGSSTAFSYYWNNAVTIADGTTPAFRLSPAIEEGVPDAEFLVATDAGHGSSSNITLCAWTNTSNIHTTSPTLTCDQNNGGTGYADPIGARQPGTSFTIFPGYGPKQVYYKAGHLFLAQTTAVAGTSDAIFLAEIQPRLTSQAAHNPQWVNGFNVIEDAILSYGGYDSYMPTLMGTDEDDVLLVSNISNSSVNPSIIYTGRKASDPGIGFGQGQAAFVAVGSDINTSGYWGEYSACAVPLNSVTRGGIWCGGEYMGSQANPGWNTRLYRLRLE